MSLLLVGEIMQTTAHNYGHKKIHYYEFSR